MKLRTSKKEINNSYNTILKAGYCELQTLLKYQDPFAYSCGIYGWNCDYYDINGVCISTGYRAIGKRVDYNIVNEYERKAQEIVYNGSYSYDQIKSLLDALITEFIEKAKESLK